MSSEEKPWPPSHPRDRGGRASPPAAQPHRQHPAAAPRSGSPGGDAGSGSQLRGPRGEGHRGRQHRHGPALVGGSGPEQRTATRPSPGADLPQQPLLHKLEDPGTRSVLRDRVTPPATHCGPGVGGSVARWCTGSPYAGVAPPPAAPGGAGPPPLRLDDDNERPFPTPSRLLKCDSITGRPRRERGCFSLLRTRPGSCGGRGGRGLWGLPALTRAAGVRTLPPEDPPSVICLWPRALTQRWPHTGKDTDAVRSARKVPGGHTASTANPGGGGGGGGSELRTCCGALFQVPVFNPPPPQKNMHAEEQGDCGPHTGGGGRCSGVGPATGPTGQRG